MMKFHLFLLWPLVLLVQRHWRMLAGFVVCGLGQGLLSLAIVGWSGLWGYAGFILHLNRYYSPEKNIDINAILLNAGISSRPLLIILTVLVMGLVLWCCRRTGPLWMTSVSLTVDSRLGDDSIAVRAQSRHSGPAQPVAAPAQPAPVPVASLLASLTARHWH